MMYTLAVQQRDRGKCSRRQSVAKAHHYPGTKWFE
jgi:hypothetical protein